MSNDNTIRENNSSDLTSTESTTRNAEDGDTGVQINLCAEKESQKECDEIHEETEQSTDTKTEEKLNLKDDSCNSEVFIFIKNKK